MRVVLCYPSLLPGHKPKYGLQPLGVLYLATLLRQHGIEAQVVDADIEGLTVAEIVLRILACEPDLVGLSLMTPQLPTALEVSRRLKEARPNLRIVLGGAHIDSTLADTFQLSDAFDFAVHGEGEYPLLEICQNMQQHGTDAWLDCVRDVSNVLYRDETGRVVENPARAFLKELDELPSVDYDLVDVRKYRIPTMKGDYVISMMLSRGCPFKCTFCDAPITMGKKLRFWSIPRIVADIRRCVETYGCKNFVFKDSTFSANKKWTDQFCDALLASGLGISWRCNTRVNLVPSPLLEKMHRAGCYVINFGVESGHPDILQNLQKEVDMEQVYDAHRRCREIGIRTYSTFLVGSPGETEETVKETIRVACEIRPSLAMFFVATAYPGTPMYDRAVRDGVVEPRWWASQRWDPATSSAFQQRWGWTAKGAIRIPGFDAEAWQKRATRAFYLRPTFVRDTAAFVLENPYFLRHLVNLGQELIPFYKVRLPWRKVGPREEEAARANVHARCPSAPNWDYEPRAEAVRAVPRVALRMADTRARP